MNSTTNIISADGTKITVDQAGTGPAVVLIGGGPTNRYAAMGLAALLADQLTVYNYDRRGRGDSGNTLPYSVEREFEDLAGVLELAGGTAAVYGTSVGSIWAIEAAARNLPISRLALWEPPYVVDASRAAPPADYSTRIATLVDAGRNGDALDYFFTQAVGMPADMVASMHDAPFWEQMQGAAQGLVYDAQLIGDFTIPSARLKAITTPTLVMDGATTPWLTSAAEAVGSTIATSQRKTLAGQQHNVADEAIAPLIIEFVLDGAR